ncbi:MAG: glycosyltransferase, exosortase A system-associated [Pirellulales bacterium]|nr:glycosyltransferase, exosortase A system-associated [Pirellulales bacterium]
MKILHILNHSIPHTDGYAIRSANIVHFQLEMGLQPLVLTSGRHTPASACGCEIIDGVTYYRTPPHREFPLPFLRQMMAIRKMAARIEAVVLLERPDILHAHSPCLWGKAASRVARRHKLPLAYEIRGLWEDAAVDQGKTRATSLRYRLSRALETSVVREATVITTIAGHLKDELALRGIPPEKIHLVPNGVDAEKFQPRQSDVQLASSLKRDGQVLVGYIGTLYPWEGVEVLLHAVPRIIARAPNVKFLIVGGGEQADFLRNAIRDLNLEAHVHFVGEVRHADIARYYSILDILVYPRRRTRNTELCTPLKPLEAMAMGKAVLGSDVGGIRELLAKETGVLFQAGDPADLAEKCLSLILQPEMRIALGRNSRAYVVSTRNWETIARRYLDAYAATSAGNAATTNGKS